MWLDSSEWSIALPADSAVTMVERFASGEPTKRVTVRRGETESTRGIDIIHTSPQDIHVVLNERGAQLLERIGVAVLGADGHRVWLRADFKRGVTSALEI